MTVKLVEHPIAIPPNVERVIVLAREVDDAKKLYTEKLLELQTLITSSKVKDRTREFPSLPRFPRARPPLALLPAGKEPKRAKHAGPKIKLDTEGRRLSREVQHVGPRRGIQLPLHLRSRVITYALKATKEEKKPVSALARALNLPHATLGYWLKHSKAYLNKKEKAPKPAVSVAMTGEGAQLASEIARYPLTGKKGPRKFPDELRQRVVTFAKGRISTHDESTVSLGKALGLGESTLRDWLRKSKKNGAAHAPASA